MNPKGAGSYLLDGPADGEATLLLAHGAGAPMDSPFLARIAAGVANAGIRVVRFEFPYMHARRERGERRPPDRETALREAWRTVIAEYGGGPAVVIGGKSLGGRIASLVADEASARGLVCLGYPFHPPGQPQRLRTRHLAALRTPALIVQGTRDPFGRPGEVAGYELSRSICLHWLEDGEHSFRPRKRSGRTEEANLTEAVDVVAAFVKGLATR